jgi:transglutaminase-like putative cysteine protease
MAIRVFHESVYEFEAPAVHSMHTLRLTPRPHAGQRVRRWTVTGNGNREMPTVEDAFGNTVHTLSVVGAHERIRVTVSGEVITSETNGVIRDAHEPLPWDLYRRQTWLTQPDDAIRDLAEPLRAAVASDQISAMHDLMNAVREAMDYEADHTDADTTAAQALAGGKGVCQDYAHLYLSCVRHLGLRARYVTGYLAANGEDSLYEPSHAWAEVLVDGLGWVGFDVANEICPADSYVRIAVGLDYRSAAPVLGVRRGGGEGSKAERVEVMTVQEQNQRQMPPTEDAGPAEPAGDAEPRQ